MSQVRKKRQKEEDGCEEIGSTDDSGDGFDVNGVCRKNDASDGDARSRRKRRVGQSDEKKRHERMQDDIDQVKAKRLEP